MLAFNSDITHEYLKSILSYDKESGIFSWIKSGKIAGSVNSVGYVLIKILGRSYKAHRLAFLYMTNEWPLEIVDHINRIRNDNRWGNLRSSSILSNYENRNNNVSGQVGVYWDKNRSKWHARSQRSGKSIHIGYFEKDEYEKACNAYMEYFTKEAV